MTTQDSAQQVVVGVDGSAESVAALKWAATYAAATGAPLRAIIAWHYPSAVGPSAFGRTPAVISDEVRDHMTEMLGQAVAEGAPGIEVAQEIAYGHPAQVLVDESGQAGLLVVGNRGHGAFTSTVMGSVSLHCVSHALCPVVVVKLRAAAEHEWRAQ